MPLKSWNIDLGEFQIAVRRDTESGDLVDFRVVLLAWDGKDWVCVTRYDCAHDFPHRDVLGRKEGLLYKQRFPGLTLEEIFYDAIRDCQENFEAHASFFRAH